MGSAGCKVGGRGQLCMALLGLILSPVTPDVPAGTDPVPYHSRHPCPPAQPLSPLEMLVSPIPSVVPAGTAPVPPRGPCPPVPPAGLVLFPRSPRSPLRPQGLVRCLFGEELERVPAGEVACWMGGVVCKKKGRGTWNKDTVYGKWAWSAGNGRGLGRKWLGYTVAAHPPSGSGPAERNRRGPGRAMGQIEWAMWANEQALAAGLSECRGCRGRTWLLPGVPSAPAPRRTPSGPPWLWVSPHRGEVERPAGWATRLREGLGG